MPSVQLFNDVLRKHDYVHDPTLKQNADKKIQPYSYYFRINEICGLKIIFYKTPSHSSLNLTPISNKRRKYFTPLKNIEYLSISTIQHFHGITN